MLGEFKTFFTQRLPSWRAAVPSSAALSKAAPIVLLAAALTVAATAYLRYDASNYKPLFGAHESVPLSDMAAALDAEHIPYRIHPDTGQVLVPARQVGHTRLLLAAKGITAKLPAGLEQVDQSDPLGASQFVEDVRFRRGLESELAQSIASLDPVQKARVHLSQAKPPSFVLSTADKSSASVVLTLRPGTQLSKEQIAAIIHLVAGSVANLAPERVSVVDQTGAFLSARVDLNDPTAGYDDTAGRVRGRTLDNVRELLAPVVGADNFRASVAVDVNNDKIEETREQYGSDPRVTNEALRQEQERDQVALGVPGSLSNRPVNAPASGARANNGGTTRNASTRQYAYDRSIVSIKHERGRLEKLSVAVVLNNAASPTPGKPWTADQLARIERILSDGLGLSTKRGDQISVVSLDFVTAAPASAWWRDPDNLKQWGGDGAYALAGLLGFLLIVRPLLRMLQQVVASRFARPSPANAGRPEALPDAEIDNGTPRLDPPAGGQLKPTRRVMSMLDEVDLPPADSGVEVLVGHLQGLAEQEPERVAEVVKQWIENSGNASR